MPFGFVGAPAHFQSVLRQIFDKEEGPCQVEVYYDDITPHGQSMDEVWDDTLRTIACLSKWGFMINLTKSSFLVTEATLLGFDVREGGYQLGEKALKRLFGSKIPTNLKELQGLLGRLNFVSRLIPQFKRCIKPIE